ncbi:MAG: GTP-binding protein [Heteroscytonema crispum UTEX LB 1556]
MSVPNITVVAGLAGCGKTTWICQEISCRDAKFRVGDESILYFSPGTGNVPIDQTRLAAEFPEVKVFNDGQEVEFLNQLATANAVYIELGFYLELGAVSQLLDNLPYRAIAILPKKLKNSEYHFWTQEILVGAPVDTSIIQNQLWRAPTSGQVLDEDSLHEFWYEITQGAYGKVTRAKGIFDVADGRVLYGDFVAGVPSTDFLELNLPRHLEGRPQRFSGMEVSGQNLDEVAMKQTLQDCCLSESAIWQYQQQVKQILLEEKIE